MQEAVIRVREYRYMRSRMLTCLLVVSVAAWGQNNRMSVEKLVAFVQSSEKIIKEEKTMTDKQLADFLSRVKLTEKLEPRVIEDLEALDLGPLTRRALEKLRVDSQTLTASSVKQVLPDEAGPPRGADSASVIHRTGRHPQRCAGVRGQLRQQSSRLRLYGGGASP